MKLDASHCLNDLRELLRGMRERQARNIAAIQQAGVELTPVQEARFEVGFLLMRDLMSDIAQMERSWAEGHGAYRTTEQMLGHEE